MKNELSFAEFVRARRKELGMSVGECAIKGNLHQYILEGVENDTYISPSMNYILDGLSLSLRIPRAKLSKKTQPKKLEKGKKVKVISSN